MKRKYRHTKAEINIIPLMDVLLVLVAILLLLTPFMSKALNVELPQAQHAGEQSQDATLTVDIRSDGSYWHQSLKIDNWTVMEQKLRGSNKLRIQADKGASFAAITFVIDKAAGQGVNSIEFAVRE